MKKLFTATLLSVSLCASQVGSAWASVQTNLPSPMTPERINVEPQNALAVGILAGIISGIIVAYGLPYLLSKLSGDDDKDIYKACEFYEEYRTHDGIWQHDYMHDLYAKVRSSGKCDDLFDERGEDIDKHGCYIWKPDWWNDEDYENGHHYYDELCLADEY